MKKVIFGSFKLLVMTTVILVWTVPGSATPVDNSDGTITQTRTVRSQFMWLKDANFAGTTLTYPDAEARAASLNVAGSFPNRDSVYMSSFEVDPRYFITKNATK